jgi:hypothetical protein
MMRMPLLPGHGKFAGTVDEGVVLEADIADIGGQAQAGHPPQQGVEDDLQLDAGEVLA